jgi:hypothetical protein
VKRYTEKTVKNWSKSIKGDQNSRLGRGDSFGWSTSFPSVSDHTMDGMALVN